MTKPAIDTEVAELNNALADLQQTSELAMASESEQVGNSDEGQSGQNALTGKQARDRANRQREKGIRQMKFRHNGIASSLVKVNLNERVVGSAFERFFPVIESGIYNIVHRGEMVVGKDNTEKLLKQIDERIEEVEKNATAELAVIVMKIEEQEKRADWLTPSYTNPASSHEVQLRTPRAIRFVKVFEKKDKIIAAMQVLAWNNEIELAQIELVEFNLKRELKDIYFFVKNTAEGMSTKVQDRIARQKQKKPELDAA